jgi:hypothetical protein
LNVALLMSAVPNETPTCIIMSNRNRPVDHDAQMRLGGVDFEAHGGLDRSHPGIELN